MSSHKNCGSELKETYVESIRGLFARTTYGGEVFYRVSSLEEKLNQTPQLVHDYATKQQQAPVGSRIERIMNEFEHLNTASAPDDDVQLTSSICKI